MPRCITPPPFNYDTMSFETSGSTGRYNGCTGGKGRAWTPPRELLIKYNVSTGAPVRAITPPRTNVSTGAPVRANTPPPELRQRRPMEMLGAVGAVAATAVTTPELPTKNPNLIGIQDILESANTEEPDVTPQMLEEADPHTLTSWKERMITAFHNLRPGSFLAPVYNLIFGFLWHNARWLLGYGNKYEESLSL